MDVVVGSPALRKDGVAKRELLNTFFIWREKHLDLPTIGSWNFNSLLFPSLDCFQATFLSGDLQTFVSSCPVLRPQWREMFHDLCLRDVIDYIAVAPKYMSNKFMSSKYYKCV